MKKSAAKTVTWIVLNNKGGVIGLAEADSKQAAIRAWNAVNKASREVATDARERK